MKDNKMFSKIIIAIAIVVLVGGGAWYLMQNQNIQESPDDVDQETNEEVSLVGPTWNWNIFQDTAEVNDIDVETPENYTITFNEDGTANIQADCNQVIWSYELEDSALTFNTVGPSTLAYCGEESLDVQYLEYLGNTATYVMGEDGMLYLNLVADAGNMVFSQ